MSGWRKAYKRLGRKSCDCRRDLLTALLHAYDTLGGAYGISFQRYCAVRPSLDPALATS